MTAEENVATPMELAGMADAQERARAELSAVGLGHRLGHYPTQLSGGEQQRVAIARATAPRPPLIFADEPTGALDVLTGEQVLREIVHVVREQGTSVVLVTHEAQVAAYADREIVLRDGVVDPSGLGIGARA